MLIGKFTAIGAGYEGYAKLVKAFGVVVADHRANEVPKKDRGNFGSQKTLRKLWVT